MKKSDMLIIISIIFAVTVYIILLYLTAGKVAM